MLFIVNTKCKACGYCVDACPKEALFWGDEVNEKGYKAVAVDLEKCVECGTCYTVCPDTVFTIKEA